MSQKTVLITGTTSGIGRASALLFFREGYKVICHGRSEQSDFSVVDEILQHGGKAEKAFAEMESSAEIEKMFEHISQVDSLVLAAGTVSRTKPISDEMFRKTLEVNVVAPFLCAELARKKGVSSIVFVGSMRGLSHCATTPDYSASKAAVHNLTVSLARTYAPHCRVNAVAPGFTHTNMHAGMEDRLEREREKTPLQKILTPEEVAEAILFLASEKATAITGQILVADGGRNFFGH
ncbi:SDR family oxidoreductase [Candidatus Peregrinibacteria bacterium]|nr:MAG: SDR family oxidoreductase [Candidatus Peregrinibacteria bacterium]